MFFIELPFPLTMGKISLLPIEGLLWYYCITLIINMTIYFFLFP